MFDEQTLLMIVLGLVLYCLCLKPKKPETKTEPALEPFAENNKIKTESEPSRIEENFSNYRGNNPAISSQPSPTFTKDLSDYKVTEEANEVVIPEEVDNAHVDRKHDSTVDDVFDQSLLPEGVDPDIIPIRDNTAQPIDDLMPNVDSADWVNGGDMIEFDDNDVLEIPVKELYGIDTVAGSLRNASLDLRGSISNPRIEGLSPWMQSSIQADDNIVSLTGPRDGLFKDQHSQEIINNSPMYTGRDFKNRDPLLEVA